MDFEPFYPSQKLSTSRYYLIRGIDYINNRIIALGADTNSCYQSEDGGNTWSASKGVPTGVTNFTNATIFKNKMYIMGQDSIDGNKWKIYSTIPVAGNTAFVWSGPLKTLNGNGGKPVMAADGSYIYASEYYSSFITGGPSIYRSADGVAWETVYAADASISHFHCIAVDPYNTGHVWATSGDFVQPYTNAKIFRSTNYGASGSWEVVYNHKSYQAVQISFSPARVYFAADSYTSRIVSFYMEKSDPTFTPRILGLNVPRNIAVPGGAGALPGTLTGGSNPSTDISTGPANTFKIIADKEAVQRTVVLNQSVCTTGAATAAEMQVKIRALGWPYSAITVAYTDSKYVITSGQYGSFSRVWCFPGDSYDVSAALKISFSTGGHDEYGLNEMFSIWNYYAIIDPATEIMYSVSCDLAAGERCGLFYLPHSGGDWILLDTLPYDYNGTERIFIYNGYLYFDRYKHQLLTLTNFS